MADHKVSALTAVTTVDDADEYLVARSGQSYKITGANLKAAAGGGSSSALQTTVNLAAADLLALNVTPVTLVAAPGAGKFVVPLQLAYFVSSGSVDYVVPASNPIFAWNDLAGSQFPLANLGTLLQFVVENGASVGFDLASAQANSGTGIVNRAAILGASDALTDGDATLTVVTTYYIASST